MSLSVEFLDELRARTSLSKLVQSQVKLTKAGREWKGCCPFHGEKTPSFYVNDDKGFYHCFGCAAHGDAMRWLTDHAGLTFMDAVKQLADVAGMEVPAASPRAREEQDRRAPLLDAMDSAASLYAGHRDARAAAAYLDQRGITAATAATFGIGFAPDGGGFLTSNLRGVSVEAMIEAGLVIKPDDDRAPYDRFRARLMFPIHDARGRTIGFGGRVLGKGEPKYLNSPDTPLFDKGRNLFNLHRAAPAARKSERLIVVEGYMDVIGLAGVDVLDVVASNGTAVTEAQLMLMWRLAREPIMMMDGDRAGQAAMVKAALRALPGIEPDKSLRFVALPKGQDPDDVARSGGAEAVDQLLGTAIGLAELLWRHEVAQGRLDEPEGRAGLKQRLIEHCSAIGHTGVRDQYRSEFMQRFDGAFTPPPRERRPFTQRKPGERWKAPEQPVTAATKGIAGGSFAEKVRLALLAGLLRYPEVIAEHMEAVARLAVGGRYKALLDMLVEAAIAGEAVTVTTLPGLLERHGMAGAPRALESTKSLPFAFLAEVQTREARDDLVNAIYADIGA